MTYGEVIDVITAYTKNNLNKLKERAIMDYRMANLIASCVGSLIDKESKVPTLAEIYEFLFQEEKKAQDETKAKNDMEIWKQKMLAYAENHNRKRGESS